VQKKGKQTPTVEAINNCETVNQETLKVEHSQGRAWVKGQG